MLEPTFQIPPSLIYIDSWNSSFTKQETDKAQEQKEMLR